MPLLLLCLLFIVYWHLASGLLFLSDYYSKIFYLLSIKLWISNVEDNNNLELTNQGTLQQKFYACAGSFMHVQMCVYGLSCWPFGHDIDTACYYRVEQQLLMYGQVCSMQLSLVVYV